MLAPAIDLRRDERYNPAVTAMLSGLQNLLKKLSIDPTTAILTAVVLPVAVAVGKIIARSLKRWTTYLTEAALFWLSKTIMTSMASRVSLRQYCRLALGQHQYLYVPSLKEIKIEVDKLFITLRLAGGPSNREYTHWSITSAGPRLRVIGDPGCGKSSLLKKIFRDTCRAGLGQLPLERRLPVLIELRKLRVPTTEPSEPGKWLLNVVREHVQEIASFRMGECFDTYVSGRGLMLLLDGLDEVASTNLTYINRAMVSLSATLAAQSDKTVVILSMRTQLHDLIKDMYRDEFGLALEVRPFTPSDIHAFLHAWPFEGDNLDAIARLQQELTDRPSLRESCSNPLVLSMYVAQSAMGAFTSESRTEFYRTVAEELVVKRRLRQGTDRGAQLKLREQREKLLGRVAYEHMINPSEGANVLPYGKAISLIRSTLKCSTAEAEREFQTLSTETGLFLEERPRETFRFIHLTFCEFFAALEVVEGMKDGWAVLLRRHEEFSNDPALGVRSRLREVVPFVCGLLPRGYRGDAIARVLSSADYSMILRCFIESKSYEEPGWRNFIEIARNRLVGTPSTERREEWLRDLHLFNVAISDALACASRTGVEYASINISELYARLIGDRPHDLQNVLSSYATHDAAAAFRVADLCGIDLTDYPQVVVKARQQRPFLDLLIAKIRRSNDQAAVWAPLIVDAAASSGIVAYELALRPEVPQLAAMILTDRRADRWNVKAFRSLYTQLLTLATRARLRPVVCNIPKRQLWRTELLRWTRDYDLARESEPVDIEPLARASLISSVTAPSRRVLLGVLLGYNTAERLSLVVLSYTALVGVLLTQHRLKSPVGFVLVSTSLASYIVPLVYAWGRKLREFYLDVMNLPFDTAPQQWWLKYLLDRPLRPFIELVSIPVIGYKNKAALTELRRLRGGAGWSGPEFCFVPKDRKRRLKEPRRYSNSYRRP